MSNNYRPRLIEQNIRENLEISGGILIEGCKWCGKTTTAVQHAHSCVEFQNPDEQENYNLIAQTRPSLFLEGDKPRLFDEWQRYPIVWDAIRMDIDRSGKTGQYILTGSAKPADGATMHTGTGRIARVVMRPMSLFESGFSDGKVSFRDIVQGLDIGAINKSTLEDYADYAVWGGWPMVPSFMPSSRSRVSKNYVDSVLHEEVKALLGSERNYNKMQIVLKSLARNVSTPVSISTIEEDSKTLFGSSFSRITVRDYLNTLEKLFVVYNIQATTLEFRSKAAIRTTPKRELVDPSIATAILGMQPADLLHDLRTFGFIFECMAMRDLIVYSGGTGENVYYYRNSDGFEVDAIVHADNGKWGAVEVKLGAGQIESAVENLLKFQKMSEEKPAFLMVLTAAGTSYRRPDGIYVVSLGSLKD